MSSNVLVTINNNRETVKNVRNLHHTLATEEVFQITRILSNFFIGGFKKVLSVFKSTEYRYGGIDGVKTTDLVTDLMKSRGEVAKIRNSVSYSLASKIMLPTPIGMYCNYVTAVDNIGRAMDIVNPTIEKALDEVYLLASRVLSDEDFRKTNRPFKMEINLEEKTREVVKHIEKIINPNFQYDRQPVSALLPNISSLVEVTESLINSSKKLGQKQLDLLDEKIVGITRVIDKLVEAAEYKSSDFNINKNTAKHLVETLEDAANYLSATVSLYHLNHMVIGSVLQCIKELNKIKGM